MARTPIPSIKWQEMTEEQRLELLRKDFPFASYTPSPESRTYTWQVTYLKADRQGRITVMIGGPNNMAGQVAGLMLIERLLQGLLDPGLTLYLEAKGDANKLRLFRGVRPQ